MDATRTRGAAYSDYCAKFDAAEWFICPAHLPTPTHHFCLTIRWRTEYPVVETIATPRLRILPDKGTSFRARFEALTVVAELGQSLGRTMKRPSLAPQRQIAPSSS